MFFKMFLCLFLFFILIKSQRFPKLVAVVEYKGIQKSSFTPEQTLTTNAEKYVKILDTLSSSYKLTMIIFPEGTLDNVENGKDLKLYATTIVPNQNPCDQKPNLKYPPFLKILSCAAKKYVVRIIFNLIEERDLSYFTSDVVIDDAGYISSSFRREDRLGSDFLRRKPISFVVPSRFFFYFIEVLNITTAVRTIFNPTSFVTGFRFSVEKVLSEQNRNYIICSNWISQLPFLTSLQVYQMWAQEFEVTIFFSGANNPKKGQGGTGIIHHTEGPILMEIIAKGGTKAFVYNFTDTSIPGVVLPPPSNRSIDELAEEMDNFYLEKDPDLSEYKSVLVNTSTYLKTELCHDKFCCNFELEMTFAKTVKKKKTYTYHLVAYRGPKTYYNILKPGGVEICALIACLDSHITSCGQRFKKYRNIGWSTTFKKIVVSAKFGLFRKEKIYYSSQFPTSLLSSIRPIHPSLTTWSGVETVDNKTNNSYYLRTFELNEPQDRILTFGIFGRNFTLYNPEVVADCGSKMLLCPVLFVIHLCSCFC